MSNKDNDEVEDLLGDIEDNINKNLIANADDKTNNNNTTPENNGNNNNDNELVEVEDIGVNTDELPPEELQKLVENNEDLMEANEEDYTKEVQEEKIRLQKELTEELNKKNEICELLQKSNNELKNKIAMSNKKYNEIIQKLEEKKQDNVEQKIILQIHELEKEITANNMETERYKKLIEQLKNKLDFKSNLERSSNFQSILKEETLRNKELKEQLNSLTRLSKVQSQYIKNYDKENQISNKLDILKKEIQATKDTIKEYQIKYNKYDKFIKLIHEKIISIEMVIKKEKTNKDEPKKKLFSKEELKETCLSSGEISIPNLACTVCFPKIMLKSEI
jgi:chromosome segregation ATPase